METPAIVTMRIEKFIVSRISGGGKTFDYGCIVVGT
jgi:hypothetical protein